MNKKIVSAILAGACAVSAMSFSVSAAGTASNKAATAGTDVKLSASMVPVVPVIDVTVPSAISAVLNPYGIAVKDKAGIKYGADGVTSALYTIVNKTDTSAVAVKVVPTISFPTQVIANNTDKETEATIALKTADEMKTLLETNKTEAAKQDGTVDTKKSLSIAIAASGSSEPTAIINVDTAKKILLKGTPEKDQKEENTYTANATNGTVDPASLDALLDLSSEDVTKNGVQAPAGSDSKDLLYTFTDVTSLKKMVTPEGADKAKLTAVPTNATPDYVTMLVLGAAEPEKREEEDKDVYFTYGQFQLTGALNTYATWTSSDKISVNVVLNIAPSGDEVSKLEPLA